MNLRLFVNPDDRREATLGITPRMRLGEFADRYFFPVVLPPAADPKLEKAHERTRREYRKTLDYWHKFTRDPPLAETTAHFFGPCLTNLWPPMTRPFDALSICSSEFFRSPGRSATSSRSELVKQVVLLLKSVHRCRPSRKV